MPRSTTLAFRAIEDRFHRIEDVQEALRQQGLESSQLVFGIDFTKVCPGGSLSLCLALLGVLQPDEGMNLSDVFL